ncbi:hypothetical protein IFM89_036219, partial [Coptis chinensis]
VKGINYRVILQNENQLEISFTRTWNFAHKGTHVPLIIEYRKDGEYNDLATIFFNTQNDVIRNLFSAKTFHEYSAQSLLTFLVTFYTLVVVTFGTAVPAGQFVPGIMIGSTYGHLVGMFVVNFYKTSTLKREHESSFFRIVRMGLIY